MSSRLSNRLNRVMKEMKRQHPCTVCFGRGKNVVTYLRHDDDERVPEVTGCPGCGEVFHIVVRFVRVPIKHPTKSWLRD